MTPLEYGRSLQSKTTQFIHIQDTIPVLHNLLFAYVLFQEKTVESSQEAKLLIEKMLAFKTPDNKLPRHIHEFPKAAHDSHYADILFVLKKLSPFAVIPEFAQPESLPEAKKALLEGRSFTPESEWEWKYALLIDPKRRCSDWDRRYTLSLDGAQWIGYDKTLTFLDYVMKKRNRESPQFHHPDLLFTALLPSFEGDVTVSSDPLCISSKDEKHLLLDFPEASLFAFAKNGTLSKDFVYKTSKESHPKTFDVGELTLYFPAMQGNAIYVNGEKQSVFYLGDTLQLTTERGVLLLSVVLEDGDGQFMGHIGRGDRPGQTVHSTKTEFVHFDYTLSIRSLKRSDACSLRFNWDYVENAGESRLTPIACNPLST